MIHGSEQHSSSFTSEQKGLWPPPTMLSLALLIKATEAVSANPAPICIIVLGKTRSLPERRLGTSVIAGSPVPRVEDKGVVEWMDGEVIWLK